MISFCLRARLTFFAGLAPFAPPVVAQIVPPSAVPVAPFTRSAPADPVVELSPFVSGASSDTVWVATGTFAGHRLRTDFNDVPNQIETLTEDFLPDLGLVAEGRADPWR